MNKAPELADNMAKPAAGPLTLIAVPDNKPTTIPPTIPTTRLASRGAPDANATPRQSGSETKKTDRPAVKSTVMYVVW